MSIGTGPELPVLSFIRMTEPFLFLDGSFSILTSWKPSLALLSLVLRLTALSTNGVVTFPITSGRAMLIPWSRCLLWATGLDWNCTASEANTNGPSKPGWSESFGLCCCSCGTSLGLDFSRSCYFYQNRLESFGLSLPEPTGSCYCFYGTLPRRITGSDAVWVSAAQWLSMMAGKSWRAMTCRTGFHGTISKQIEARWGRSWSSSISIGLMVMVA